jgi:hypothetical protein
MYENSNFVCLKCTYKQANLVDVKRPNVANAMVFPAGQMFSLIVCRSNLSVVLMMFNAPRFATSSCKLRLQIPLLLVDLDIWITCTPA